MILIESLYLLAAVLFILGIKKMTKINTSRTGNFLGALGMLVAVIAALMHSYIGDAEIGIQAGKIGWAYILLGVVIGGAIGSIMAMRVKMTSMPQMVAVLNGFGGGASVLVAMSYFLNGTSFDMMDMSTVMISIIIGAVTFTGSLVAYGKLQGILPQRQVYFKGNQFWNTLLFLLAVGISVKAVLIGMHTPYTLTLTMILIGITLLLGILLVLPIGGADMPVVISLLNSYSGMAAAATGFVLKNDVLIVSGAIVGASGIILTQIMCKAMNRSMINVVFGKVKKEEKSAGEGGYKNIKETSPEEAALILESARTVIFVPGYGLAVAQAQYATQELAEILQKKGVKVMYAIHPVAGRMPGHMNVLLAEANVPYEQLYDLDSINSEFKNADVAVILGANDVVNPAATHNKSSPIYGMPILKAHEAKNVIVVKRGMGSGFSGIENELFDYDNTRMLFGDAKKVLQQLKQEMEGL